LTAVKARLAGTSPASRLAYAVTRALVGGFTIVWTRLTVEGRHHVPTSGAFILAPVHRSYVDTPIAACLTRRRMLYMGKDSIWKWRWLGWIVSALGAFPVSRGTADREALARCLEVLERGDALVLFPEGERKDGPVVQPLFEGAAYLAARADVPIVPVGIGGSARVMPRHAKFIFPHKVHVVIGPPLRVEREPGERARRSAIAATTAQLHAELQRLFDAAQARAER
jgi:1-acyl-sn-glycerol-3-phosphate acyltransferase